MLKGLIGSLVFMNPIVASLLEFNEAFEIPKLETPELGPDELIELRIKLLTEVIKLILLQNQITAVTNQIVKVIDQIVVAGHQEEIEEVQNQEDKNDKKNFSNCFSNQHNN